MKRMKVWFMAILAILMIVQCTAVADAGWVEKKGATYLYSATGKQVSGWYQQGNDWYYLQGKGLLKNSWVRMETGMYHADAEGRIDEGWQKYKGIWYTLRKVNVGTEEAPVEGFRWYFVDGSDDMPFGNREIAGRKYDVTNKKAKLTGWSQTESGKLHFNEDGTMDVGWQKVDGKTMYFDLTGRTVKGQKYIDGAYYTFSWKGELTSDKPVLAEITSTPIDTGKAEETATKPASTEDRDQKTTGHNEGQKPVDYGETQQSAQEAYPPAGSGEKHEDKAEDKTTDTQQTKPEEKATDTQQTKPEEKQPAVETQQTDPSTKQDTEQKTEEKTEPDNKTESKDTGTSPAAEVEQKTDTEADKKDDTAKVTEEYTYSYVTETVDIPFGTEYIDSPYAPKGEEGIAAIGQNGQKEITYQIKKDKNGKEVSRTVSSEKIIKSPVTQVYYRGTWVSDATYEVVQTDDLGGNQGTRTEELDKRAEEWAMEMAQTGVRHSSPDGGGNYGESVGGWGSLEEAVAGTEQHGGNVLSEADNYGFAVVKKTETQPDGSVKETYYAVEQGTYD